MIISWIFTSCRFFLFYTIATNCVFTSLTWLTLLSCVPRNIQQDHSRTVQLLWNADASLSVYLCDLGLSGRPNSRPQTGGWTWQWSWGAAETAPSAGRACSHHSENTREGTWAGLRLSTLSCRLININMSHMPSWMWNAREFLHVFSTILGQLSHFSPSAPSSWHINLDIFPYDVPYTRFQFTPSWSDNRMTTCFPTVSIPLLVPLVLAGPAL